MNVVKKLQEQLFINAEKNDEKIKTIVDDFAREQRIIKRKINQELKNQSDQRMSEIVRNYDIGMLTLSEMIEQEIDCLKYVARTMYVLVN
jgi:phosphopantothenate synthetase